MQSKSKRKSLKRPSVRVQRIEAMVGLTKNFKLFTNSVGVPMVDLPETSATGTPPTQKRFPMFSLRILTYPRFDRTARNAIHIW